MLYYIMLSLTNTKYNSSKILVQRSRTTVKSLKSNCTVGLQYNEVHVQYSCCSVIHCTTKLYTTMLCYPILLS